MPFTRPFLSNKGSLGRVYSHDSGPGGLYSHPLLVHGRVVFDGQNYRHWGGSFLEAGDYRLNRRILEGPIPKPTLESPIFATKMESFKTRTVVAVVPSFQTGFLNVSSLGRLVSYSFLASAKKLSSSSL